ncbi:MAG: hypothetical protein MPL62_08375 [Alphaproteobacteria bacterium]|nr:hypothetical protein [Alphaproteobacteria bacterium]
MSEMQEPPPKDVGLEEEIKEAARLAETAPEQYRIKAFEILLNLACSTRATASSELPSQDTQVSNGYRLPVSVLAFMAQFKIPESNINHYFIITGLDEIAPRYTIQNKSAARSQIQFACMFALEHALHDGSFEFSFEKVKDACRDNHCLDERNFLTNFKRKSKLFKSFDDKEHIVLSPVGKEYLADLLDELSNKV